VRGGMVADKRWSAKHTPKYPCPNGPSGRKKGRQASLKPCSGVEKAISLYWSKCKRLTVKTLKER